jgi:hypothetical protein
VIVCTFDVFVGHIQTNIHIAFLFHTAVNSPPVLYSQFISREIPPKHNSGLDAVSYSQIKMHVDVTNGIIACRCS